MTAPVGLIYPPPTGHISVEAASHGIHREFGGGQQLTQFDGLLQRGVTMLMLRLRCAGSGNLPTRRSRRANR